MELLNESQKKYHLFGTKGEKITLPYNENFFTIRFSVPEMLTPDKINFLCYMEGFEQGWQEIGMERQVSYTNIPPGEYFFYVKSTDSSGNGIMNCRAYVSLSLLLGGKLVGRGAYGYYLYQERSFRFLVLSARIKHPASGSAERNRERYSSQYQ